MGILLYNTLYLGKAMPGTGGGGSVDPHNLGYFATSTDLETAYPTATAGDYASVVETGTIWVWDSTNSEWIDSEAPLGAVTSVNGQRGVVVLDAEDVGAEVATTLTTISTATVTQELATSTVYNCGEMTSVEITFPGTASTGFISQLNFTSGITPTAFTSPVGMKWLGDDVSTTFVPVASKRYAIMFFYDGTAYRGIVQAA